MKKIIKAVTVSQSLGFVENQIDDLKKQYEVQLLSSPGDRIDQLCDTYSVKGHSISIHRRISPFKDLISLWKIYRVFRREKPDMIHSMTPKAGLLCMLAGWLARVPRRVHTFTGLVWPTTSGLMRKILIFTDWVTCACATHIIPEGVGVMNDLQDHVTKKPMKVLGYGNVKGVDMVRFSRRPEVIARAAEIVKEDVFTYLFVGRLVRDKGINELITAFENIHHRYPATRLILVGEYESNIDPLRPDTLAKIEEHSAIEFVGLQSGDNLLAYYAASDCFVFPSYREGFPNTVLEAGAMGLPSIVTDINGSREIIVHDENGFIIPPQDADSLCKAMEDILIMNEKRFKFVANARYMIESKYEQNFVKNCLYEFYSQII